jgi:hemerythrin-like domain-containing protein
VTRIQVVPAEDAEMIHEEHVELRTSLGELDQALDHLYCNSGSPFDVSGAPELLSIVRRFQAFLPLHFQHEENGILERVSTVSTELMELTLQLKKEHQYLAGLFEVFAEVASGLKETDDVTAQVTRTRLLGGAFTNQMLRHISTEETELAGFL